MSSKVNYNVDVGQIALGAAVIGGAYLLLKYLKDSKEKQDTAQIVDSKKMLLQRDNATVSQWGNSPAVTAQWTTAERNAGTERILVTESASSKKQTQYGPNAQTTYAISSPDISALSPFERQMLNNGVSIGTIERYNSAVNTIGSIFPWNW